jgi:hypothetical protein
MFCLKFSSKSWDLNKKAIGWVAYPADGLGNLVPAGRQAGPATMTREIIMPTGIAMVLGRRKRRPVRRLDIRTK